MDILLPRLQTYLQDLAGVLQDPKCFLQFLQENKYFTCKSFAMILQNGFLWEEHWQIGHKI